MPLVSATFSATMMASMMASFASFGGGLGKDLKKLCDTIADGIDMSIKSTATFTTQDTGTGPLCGGIVSANGTGVGLIVSPGIASAAISLKLLASGFIGKGVSPMCSAIDSAFVTYMSTASLSSTHSIVYIGSGTISSVILDSSIIKANIMLMALANGLLGKNIADLADAIASGISNALKTATGQVTITGSVVPQTCPAVPVPIPNAAPGAGTGSSIPGGGIL